MVTPTTWELVINNIPRSEGEEVANVLLKIFGTVIPAMDMNEIENWWQGHKTGSDPGGGLLFGDWTISYFVNSDFSNWHTLYDWMKYCARGGGQPEDYTIGATLFAKNNFGETVLLVRFSSVWIKSLGEVTLNTQSGDDFIQSTVSLTYAEFTVHPPGEAVSGGTLEDTGLVL